MNKFNGKNNGENFIKGKIWILGNKMNKLLYRFEMLILASEKDENTEPLWLRFYIIQMTFYIFINEKSCLSKDQVQWIEKIYEKKWVQYKKCW